MPISDDQHLGVSDRMVRRGSASGSAMPGLERRPSQHSTANTNAVMDALRARTAAPSDATISRRGSNASGVSPHSEGRPTLSLLQTPRSFGPPVSDEVDPTLTMDMDMPDGGTVRLLESDLQNLQDLGSGSSGSVAKVKHTPTGILMARKVDAREVQRMLRFCHRQYLLRLIWLNGAKLFWNCQSCGPVVIQTLSDSLAHTRQTLLLGFVWNTWTWEA